MKTLYPILTLVSLFFFLPAKAQVNKQYVYTVHVGAYVNPRPADFDPIRSLGYLYGRSFDYNLQRIYLGDYSQEPDARKVLADVKAKGFTDAYITKIPANQGDKAAVIQLATRLVSEKINWNDYATGKPTQVISLDGALKIVAGPFASADAAAQQLGMIRSKGFSDAFVKVVDAQLLHPLDLEQPAEEVAEDKPDLDQIPESFEESSTLPVAKEVLTEKTVEPTPAPPPAEPIPSSYDEVMTKKAPKKTIALPKIRTKVKRNSAYELQTVLKSEGTYKSSLDGYYGKGTAAGYEEFKTSNLQMIKYDILAEHTARPSRAAKKGSLQYAINHLMDQPTSAIVKLEQANSAVAKAYRAYLYFESRGASQRVDQLMNDAIKQAFSRKELKNKPPFDYESNYTYKKLDQLLLHLRYIQAAEPEEVAVPCWLFSKHPKAAGDAFESGKFLSDENYAVEPCDEMIDWDEIELLATIAEDMNPTGKVDKRTIKQNAFKRSRLLLVGKELSPEAAKNAEEWHKNLWKGLDAWGQEDLLHQKMILPLRVTYFQSMVRLEDYYMDKGHSPKMARSLAAATIETIVNPHLYSYIAS